MKKKKIIKNNFKLVDIVSVNITKNLNNMIDLSIEDDESFTLSNGIISHNSAHSSVLAGLSPQDTNYIGVYPLKGKPLNVRDIELSSIRENEQIKKIINILGLEFGKKYTDTKKLRYGKVVLMADADCIDENTMVKTKRGYIPIKYIDYDDYVLTHNNKWKKVLNIIKTKKNNVVSITVNGEDYIFGEEHEIPVFRDGDVIFIKAKNILKTDKILKKKENV
jgi:hypothetical protein